jgi:hypothetical protein
MYITTKWLSLALVLVASLVAPVSAQTTITAASCKESDVSAVVNGPIHVLAAGDTIVIPSGSCTWTTQLIVTVPSARSSSIITTIQGATVCTGSGDPAYHNLSCMDGTTITDDVSGNNPALAITVAATGEFRVTGLALKASTKVYHGTVNISTARGIDATNPGVRVDHCHFSGAATGDLELDGTEYGVIDHNVFSSTNGDENATRIYNGAYWHHSADGLGHASWADGPHFGSNEFIVEEDNYFYGSSSLGPSAYFLTTDCWAGGRYVLRFNTIGFHEIPYTHGTTGSGGAYRGCRALEVYGNRAAWDPSSTVTNYTFMNAESGTGYVWGNNISGQNSLLNQDYSRRLPTGYAQIPPPAGWGYCGSKINGRFADSPWDQNANATNGYACMDQPGRGKGDLLGGNFPTVCDETTGCKTYGGKWPSQELEPWYFWDNTVNAATRSNWAETDTTPPLMTNNRDYYFQCGSLNSSCTSSFTGTAGVGQGMLASRPSTCTKGVAYWATDQGNWNQSGNGFGQGELYICTATNTWTMSYEPYAYPDPLTQTQTRSATLDTYRGRIGSQRH